MCLGFSSGAGWLWFRFFCFWSGRLIFVLAYGLFFALLGCVLIYVYYVSGFYFGMGGCVLYVFGCEWLFLVVLMLLMLVSFVGFVLTVVGVR